MRTQADALWEEGRQTEQVRARQDVLLLLLWERFDHLPERVPDIIRATDDATRLDAWLDNFANAQTLADVGIPARRRSRNGQLAVIDEAVAERRQMVRDAGPPGSRRREVMIIFLETEEAYRTQGREVEAVASRQEILVRLLRRRFRRVSWQLVLVIGRNKSVGRLNDWLRNFATAQAIADVGIFLRPDQWWDDPPSGKT